MPANMITALVASSPNVAGSRMLMPASGPIPGSTPTSVPTKHPRNAYHSTSGRNATEKPSNRLSNVPSTLEPDQPALERRLQQDREQRIDCDADAGAVHYGEQRFPALEQRQAGEQQADRQNEAERGVERDRSRRRGRHDRGVLQITPIDLAHRVASTGARTQKNTQRDHENADQLGPHAGAR